MRTKRVSEEINNAEQQVLYLETEKAPKQKINWNPLSFGFAFMEGKGTFMKCIICMTKDKEKRETWRDMALDCYRKSKDNLKK